MCVVQSCHSRTSLVPQENRRSNANDENLNTGTVIPGLDTYFYDPTRCEIRKGCDAEPFSWCGIQVHAAESGDRVLLFDIRAL